MEMVILILKAYMIFVIFVMAIYMIRHYHFTMNRVMGEQRLYYHDIIDSDLPTVTVIIPMHNEEKVARNILDLLISSSYPREKFEIIPVEHASTDTTEEGLFEIMPIDDHSTDTTQKILSEYSAKYPQIKSFIRSSGRRGKPSALNDALKLATGAVIIIFDADYLPPAGIVRDIAVSFKDPEVGAVMGRVIPQNLSSSLLARLLDLERTGGYQVGQQARHNLGLMPQYGGTVGGFRKDIVTALGGFNPDILTEDTELTFKLFAKGWKVIYANRAECYEEAPEDWDVRAKQVKRWARGHTQVMLRYTFPILKSKYLSAREKFDGILLLGIYMIPFILLLGIFDSIALFFLGEMNIIESMLVFIFVATYNSFGNFAPFYQIGTGSLLDSGIDRIKLLPMFIFNFVFYLWYISKGVIDAIIDLIRRRKPEWQKTERFRKEKIS